MTKLYHPARYARMLAARQELAEAYEQTDFDRVLRFSTEIDQLQLEHWTDGCFERPPELQKRKLTCCA